MMREDQAIKLVRALEAVMEAKVRDMSDPAIEYAVTLDNRREELVAELMKIPARKKMHGNGRS